MATSPAPEKGSAERAFRWLFTTVWGWIVTTIGVVSGIATMITTSPAWWFAVPAVFLFLTIGTSFFAFHKYQEAIALPAPAVVQSLPTQVVVSITSKSPTDFAGSIEFANYGSTVIEHFRQHEIILLTSDPAVMTFKPGDSPEWPGDADLPPKYKVPYGIANVLKATRGAVLPANAAIKTIWVYYMYVNADRKVVDKDVAFTFYTSGWLEIRPEGLSQRDEFKNLSRKYLGYDELKQRFP